MKRAVLYLIIHLFAIALFPLSAQESAPSISGMGGSSLTTILDSIGKAQSAYTIHFIRNDLEHLRVSARIKEMKLPDAVKRICKGLPVKVKTKGKQIFVQYKPEKDFSDRQGVRFLPLCYPG